ncbi:MAG: flagellar hook-associated protein 3 FlgL [Halioglobus sp.]|jgi:flagellar hook-associated protein 3 FlgL
MRLSSAQIFQQGISSILAQQSKLQQTEQQLATGRRILTPADDPVGAVQVLSITEDMKLIDQYQRSGNIAEGQLAQEETALADVGNVLNRVRELVVQANNASQSPESRRSIGTEVAAKLDELQSLANTRDASGEYIFAGFQSRTEPFSLQSGSYSYNGDNGQRMLQLARSTQIAVRDSGFDVFVSVPSGNGSFDIQPDVSNAGTAVIGATSASGGYVKDTYNIVFDQPTPADPVTYQVTGSASGVVASGTYVSGDSIDFAGASINLNGVPADGDSFQVLSSPRQDMFSTLQDAVSHLNNAASSPSELAAFNNGMSRALNNIDGALGHVLDLRADVGVRLNHVDRQLDINDSFNLQLEATLSEIQDLDYAEAISRFNLQLTTLEASQQAYIKLQGLSLFNFL